MKFLIIGHARHGKDTVAEILHDEFGLKFESSSMAACRIFLYDKLKLKYGYETIEACFNDRMNHREEWKNLICEYNKDDKCRLTKYILLESDIYVGMRDSNEIKECIDTGLIDLVIWVDRTEHLPPESVKSFNIRKSDADIIIDNNGTLNDLRCKVKRLFTHLLYNYLT